MLNREFIARFAGLLAHEKLVIQAKIDEEEGGGGSSRKKKRNRAKGLQHRTPMSMKLKGASCVGLDFYKKGSLHVHNAWAGRSPNMYYCKVAGE